jgi:hypothetical protein
VFSSGAFFSKKKIEPEKWLQHVRTVLLDGIAAKQN